MNATPKYQLVSTLRDLKQVIARCKSPTALDFETTALRPADGRVRLVSLCDAKVHALVDFDKIKGGFAATAKLFEGKEWVVFQSGFEMRWFQAAGATVKLLDVGHLRRAIMGGGGLALKDMAKWDLSEELDKSEQASAWSNKVLTQSQLDYAYLDADVTWRLWLHWTAKADDRHMSGFAMLNDMLEAVIEMEESGMLIDPKRHRALIAKWEVVRDDRVRQIREMVGEDEVANINSDIQWSDYFARLCDDAFLKGWPRTTKSGQLSMKGDILRKLAGVVHGTPLETFFDALADYKKISKYLSSFGQTLITASELSHDHRIRARFNIGQARTCRFCVAGDTLVDTIDGPRRIDGVLPGTLVQTHLGRYRPTLHLIYKGRERMYKVTTEAGASITCTLRHRMLTTTGWRTLEEILDASERRAHEGYETVQGGACRLLEAGPASLSRAGLPLRHKHAHGACYGGAGVIEGATTRGALQAAAAHQARRVEPDVRQDRHAAPQLQGGVRGWIRLLDEESRVEAIFRAPNSHGEDDRYSSRSATGGFSRPPHRREPAQQLAQELGARHPYWTPSASLTLEDMGFDHVWDIEVAEDHSYTAGGVVHHNSSSQPNLQQTPRNNELLGDETSVRSSFIAGLGRKLVALDYSGIELRVLALLAEDEQLLEDMVTGDVHSEVASVIAGKKIDKTTPEGKAARTKAKAVSFGIIYGAGASGLSVTMRTSRSRAQDYIDFWQARYPNAFDYRNKMMTEAQRTKFIRCVDGGTIYMGKKPELPQCANYPVQRGALSVMARAIVRHKNTMDAERHAGRQRLTRILSTIHDAMIDEAATKDAQRCLTLLERDMTLGYLDMFPGAPTERLVEGGVGVNWGDL